jgi:hypothetical protein
MEDLEKQLLQLQTEERETKELELKSAQERRQAVEDLEKGVSIPLRFFRCIFSLTCNYFAIYNLK